MVSVLSAQADTFGCFSKAFYNEKLYEPFKCHKNIRNFISKCKLFNHPEAEVLFLYSNQKLENEKRGPLTPMLARGGVLTWDYHVILKIGDQVFDFDYDEIPQSISFYNYVDSMFPDPSKVQVRTIKAMNYLIYYKDLPEFYIYNHMGVLSESKTLESYFRNSL